MKLRSYHSAFTLIELITVIAIIAILMSLLFPVIGIGRHSVRAAKARTVAKGIVHSCKSYANDYGKYPAIAAALTSGANSTGGGAADQAYYSYGDTDIAKCKVSNEQLFDVLRAIDRGPNADHALNRRKQSYFEEPKAVSGKPPRDGFADGKDFPEDIRGQLLDPWGKQYCIVLDADGDGLLMLNAFFQDQTEITRNPAVAFSMGANHVIGGKGYPGRLHKEGSTEAPDDIVSWE